VSVQVGGWSEVYEGPMFTSVRGSGHEVLLFQLRKAHNSLLLHLSRLYLLINLIILSVVYYTTFVIICVHLLF